MTRHRISDEKERIHKKLSATGLRGGDTALKGMCGMIRQTGSVADEASVAALPCSKAPRAKGKKL